MDSEYLYMDNSATFKVRWEGHTEKTSKKFHTLNSVLQVVDIIKNLVSGSILSKNGFKKWSLEVTDLYSLKGIFVIASLK